LHGREPPGDFFSARRLYEKTFAEIVGIALEGTGEEGDDVLRKGLPTTSGISDAADSLHIWKFTECRSWSIAGLQPSASEDLPDGS
jgi:hypothetical protein